MRGVSPRPLFNNISKQMSQSSPQPLLIVLSAPSGGGKTTLVKQLLATRPAMTRVVTLREALSLGPDILAGNVRGRLVVDVNG